MQPCPLKISSHLHVIVEIDREREKVVQSGPGLDTLISPVYELTPAGSQTGWVLFFLLSPDSVSVRTNREIVGPVGDALKMMVFRLVLYVSSRLLRQGVCDGIYVVSWKCHLDAFPKFLIFFCNYGTNVERGLCNRFNWLI